jgi:hypothetical protein
MCGIIGYKGFRDVFEESNKYRYLFNLKHSQRMRILVSKYKGK